MRPVLHLAFLLTRPLTVGVRGICYDRETNKILLVKHTYSEGWGLPGGGVEVGESMLTALKRELSEEAGLKCESARVLDVHHNSSISKRDHVVIFFVEEWQQEDVHERPKLEIAETAWFDLTALPTALTSSTKFGLKLFPQNYL